MDISKGRRKVILAAGSHRPRPDASQIGADDVGALPLPATRAVQHVTRASPRNDAAAATDHISELRFDHEGGKGRNSPTGRWKRKVALVAGSPRPEASLQSDLADNVGAFAQPGPNNVVNAATRRNDANPTDDISELSPDHQSEGGQLAVVQAQLVAETPQEMEERLRAQFQEEAQQIARREILHQATQAEVVETTKSPSDPPPPNRKRLWMIFGIILVVAVGAGAGLGISVAPSSSDDGASSSPTDVPTASPTLASTSVTEIPTQVLTATVLETAIRDIVAAISTPSSLQDPMSHQTQAIKDLANRRQVDFQDERSVIQHYIVTLFYYATGGDHDWYDSFNMFEGPDVCQWNDGDWQGVYCNNQGSITRLTYFENGLNGTLAEELSTLTELEYVSAARNYIHGALPSFVNNTILKDIRLQRNLISGTIPQTLASIPTLRHLELCENDLWGPIPSFEQNNGSLDYVDFDHNSWIEGNIAMVLANMPLSLREFHCRYCHVNGSLPTTISILANLELLALEHCDLVGNIPPEIGEMQHLTHLNLAQNSFDCSLPSELGDLATLQVLDIDYSGIEGTIPTEFGDLTELTSLNLARNDLTGTIPTQIGEASNLRYLKLSHNGLTGSIPPFSNRTSYLSLDWNAGLTGSISAILDSLSSNTTTFRCAGCILNGTLDKIGRLLDLQYLDLSESGVSGRFDFLSPLSNMVYLLLSNNALSGPIPEEVGSWMSLLQFHVYLNSLTGPLPSFKSPALSHVDVSNNLLTGNMTEFLLSLPKDTLESFWCGGNGELIGSIPTEVGEFTSLRRIGVYRNQITGTLPNELGELEHLSHLSVEFNKLHGTIPDSLASLSNLDSLQLHGNDFEDDLDIAFCIDNDIDWFLADCSKPELVVCDCCSVCWSHEMGDFDPRV